MMNALRSKGTLVVTNHDEPEAVIIAVAEYDAIMQIVEQSEAQTESALAGLGRNFDERLSVLQGRSAATRLQSTMRGRAKLGGKVKAGSGY
jgi:PHD/YefM family antitoxin component YafN of YafNO toxin-antitoxin module